MSRIAALVLFLVTSCVPAQDLVISNARILDGTGGVIEQGSIVVSDGRIVSVSAGDPEARGVLEIDAQGMTVMPGMIETHVHLLLVDRTLENQEALDEWIEQELPGDLNGYLESGFTTALSTGDHPSSILAVKRRIEIGELRGPRLLVSGPVFTGPDGHPATTVCGGFPSFCRTSLAVEVDDAEIARARVRELAEAGVDAIKAVYEALSGSVDGVRPSNATIQRAKLADDVLAAIAEEAQLHGLPLIVHARPQDALRVVELGAKRLVHPPLVGAPERSRTVERLRGASIPFSTTFGGGSPEMLATMRALWDGGVTIAFGTDRFLNNPADDISREIEALNRVLSPAEIITALTHNAATYLDLSDEIGSLEAGKLADIVIIDGDPIANISDLANVEVVIQGGQIVVDNR